MLGYILGRCSSVHCSYVCSSIESFVIQKTQNGLGFKPSPLPPPLSGSSAPAAVRPLYLRSSGGSTPPSRRRRMPPVRETPP